MLTLHKTNKFDSVINFRRSSVPKNANVALVLNWYEKTGKNLIGEEPIKNLSVEDILKLFDAPFWNKIYHCWALEETQIPAIQANVDHQFDTDKYAYFIEIYKTD